MEVEFTILKQGVDLIWALKLQEAENILSAFAETNPAFAFHYAEIAFLKAVITEDKDDAKVANDRLVAANKMARKDKKLSGDSADITQKVFLAKIVQGEVSLLDAALKFRLQKQVKGLYNFRKSWKYYEAALAHSVKLDKNLPCYKELMCYLDCNVGFFHFIIGVIPREFQWIAEGIGFKGNREQGLAELKRSVDAKGIKSSIAIFHNIWIYSFFNEDFAEGEKWIAEMQKVHPNSPLLNYLAGYVYRKQGKIDIAQKAFEDCQKAGAEVKQMQKFCEYEKGYCLYLNLDFDKASKVLQQFIDSSPGESFRVYASLQLAMCYELLNQNDKATANMKALLPLVRKGYDYDEYSERKAKKYLATKGGFSQFEKDYHVATLHQEACRWKEAIALGKTLQAQAKDDDQNGRALYIQASCLQKTNDLAEAKKLYQDVLGLEKGLVAAGNLMVIPHTLCGLAEILMEEKQFDAAERTLRKAKDIKESYDFSQLLGWRVKRNLERLRKLKST